MSNYQNQSLLESAFEKGCDEGFKDGHKKGYSEGHEEGFHQGYMKALDRSIKDFQHYKEIIIDKTQKGEAA